MKIFKKFTTQLLTAALLLTSFTAVPPVMAAAEVTAEANCTDKAELLFKLGIASEPEAGSVWSETVITNAEFAAMVVNMVSGLNVTESMEDLPYDDVYLGHTYYSHICYGYKSGILDKADVLNPDSPLDAQLAVDTAVNALGFSSVKEYVSNYNRYISRSDLLKGVDGSKSEFSLNDAYNIIYNALGMNTIELDGVYTSKGEASYNVADGDSLAHSVFDLERVDGRLTATSIAAVNGSKTSDGYVMIDKTKYSADGGEIFTLIGKEITAWVDENGKIYHSLDNGETDTVEIDAANIMSIDGSSVKYSDGKKTKTVNLSYPTIVVNGGELDSSNYNKNNLKISEGKVTLIKSGGKYDVVSVEDSKNFILGVVSVDTSGNIELAASNIKNTKIIVRNDAYSSAVNTDGESIDLASAEAGSLITYKMSPCGTYADIIVSKNVINTDSAGRRTSGGKVTEIVIDGVTYSVNDEVHLGNVDLNVDGNYEYYITPYGNIGAVDFYNSDLDVTAFMMGIDMDNGLSGDIKIRFINNEYNELKEALVLDAAKKVTVDGTKKEGQAIIDAVKNNNGGSLNVPVIYRVNEKNEVYSLDTPYYDANKEPDTSLIERKAPAGRGGIYAKTDSRYKNQFCHLYIVPFDGIVVSCATDGSDAFVKESVVGDHTYSDSVLKMYSKGTDTYTLCVAVQYENSSMAESTDYTSNFYAVTGVKQVSYEDEIVKQLTLYNNGVYSDHIVSNKVTIAAMNTLEPGDIIRISNDTKGRINGIRVYMDYSDMLNSENGKASSTDYNAERRTAYGKVVNIEWNSSMNYYIITYSVNDSNDLESFFAAKAKFVKMSNNRNDDITFETVSPSAIKTTEYFGENADTVFVSYLYTIAGDVFFLAIDKN